MTQMSARKPTITNSAWRASASTVAASPLPSSHVRRPGDLRAALSVSGPEPPRRVTGPVPPAPGEDPGLLLIATSVRLSLLAELAPRHSPA
jgi:hypothetical protein